MRWVLRAAVLVFPACFHPVYDHPACGPHGECPSGFVCNAELVCEGIGDCGNGIINQGEECDDGNLVNGDGCSSKCTLEQCGNRILDPGEVCDDGALNGTPGHCNATCSGRG